MAEPPEGVSLEAQAEQLRAYCVARRWELVGIVRDEGKSAKDLKPPGLHRILADLPLKRRDWKGLLVVKLDRLTRSVRDLGTLTDLFKRHKVAFTSIAESVDTASASGELFFNLVASVSSGSGGQSARGRRRPWGTCALRGHESRGSRRSAGAWVLVEC